MARPRCPGVRVEVWSDVVCPWCFIGKRRLETALERFPHRDEVEVVRRSFQLDPTAPEGEDGRDPAGAGRQVRPQRRGRCAATIRGHVEETAAGEGLRYDLATGVSGNTLLAHELLYLAAEHGGAQDAPKERLLHAHFEQARSVFDVDSLGPRWGPRSGLDEAEVRAALADPRFRAAVHSDAETALGSWARPACRSSSSTAATARPARSRPSCSRSCWSGRGPTRTRWPPCPPPRAARTAPARSERRSGQQVRRRAQGPLAPRRPVPGRRRTPTVRSSPAPRPRPRRPAPWVEVAADPRLDHLGREAASSARNSSSRPCQVRLNSLASARPGQRSGQARPLGDVEGAREHGVVAVRGPVALAARVAAVPSPSGQARSAVPTHTPAAPAASGGRHGRGRSRCRRRRPRAGR